MQHFLAEPWSLKASGAQMVPSSWGPEHVGVVCPGRDLQLETSSITSFYTFMSRCNRAELENSNALAPGWASGHARGVPMCPGGVQHNHGFFSERAASRYVLNKKGRAEFRLAPGIPEFRASRWKIHRPTRASTDPGRDATLR